MVEYRKTIYENYGSRFQEAQKAFNPTDAARWGKAYDWYFRGWLPNDKNGEILDVGCGGGKLLYFFKSRGYVNLTGVDISPEQVRLARQVVPQVIEGDVLDFLAGTKGRFDLIIGLDIVEHFTKDEILKFLGLCHAALCPGGRLILQTPNAESPFGGTVFHGDFSHEVLVSPNSLLRLLDLKGFRSYEAREQGPVPFGYSPASTLRWIIWRVLRSLLEAWNLAETGKKGSGVLTRVFLVSAVKQ